MANTDFRVSLKAVLDKSGINTELKEVQNIINKHSVDIIPELKTASLRNQMKSISKEIANDFNKSFGTNLTGNDIFKAYEDQAKQLAKETNKIAVSASKINQVIASGGNEAKIDQLTAKFRSLGLSTERIQQELLGVNNAFNTLKGSADNASLVNNAKSLDVEYAKVGNRIKTLSSEFKGFATESKRLSTANGMSTWLENNSKSMKKYGQSINGMIARLRSADDLTVPELEEINTEFKRIQLSAREAGLIGKTLGDTFKNLGTTFSYWFGTTALIMKMVNSIRKMGTAVYDVDTAMTNLYKVTDETGAKYTQVLSDANKEAQKLGRSVSGLVEQTAAWAKLGYGIDDAANLAKISSIYANVGEIDDNTAVSDLVTSIKAFNIEASDSIRIVDSLNELGNKFATSSASLGEGLKNSASALALGGLDINKALALLTGGSEITQNAGELGNALKIGQMRVMGMKGALEELGEESEGLESVSKIQTHILNLTKGQVNIMNDADPTKFKDYYDILEGVSKVYDDLDKTKQADILETLFGKHRGNQGAAILQAFQSGQVQKALDASINSAGSAYKEQEKWMQSLEAETKKYEASFQSLSQTILDSDFLKKLVGSGTAFNNVLNTILKTLGTIPTVLGSIGIGSFIKNLGSIKTWGSELSSVLTVVNAIKSQSVLVNAGTGLLTTESVTALSTAVGGLSEKQALLALSTKNLTAEQTNQVLIEAGIVASSEKISASIAERALGQAALTAQQQTAILTELGLIDADTGLLISSNACTEAELRQALAAQGIVGANADAIVSTLGLVEANTGAATSFGLLGGSIKSLLATNPVGWLVLLGTAIYGAVKAFDYFNDSVEEVKDRMDDLMSSYESAIEKANTNASKTEGLISRYSELSKGVSNLGENINLTTDEYSEYHKVVNDVADMFPELISGYDGEGNAILTLKGNVELLRDAYKDAQKEAYNLLIASGDDGDGNDIIKNWKNRQKTDWISQFKDWGSNEVGGGLSTQQAVDQLKELSNMSAETYRNIKLITSIGSMKEIAGLTNAQKNVGYSNYIYKALGIDGTVSDEDFKKAKKQAQAIIQSLNAEIESSLSGVKTLANAYLMTNSDYEKLDEQSKNAASIIVNSLNEGIANGFNSKEDVGTYVQSIVDTINDNPEAKNAMIGLFTLDYSDMPIDEANAAINQYINYIAQILGEDPVELKIRLGFDDVDDLEEKYNNAISSAQEKFGKDETSFFKSNSINTKEEIDNWLEIAKTVNSATEAEKKYLEQGASAKQVDFISNFSNLPTDKLEEYVSLIKSGNIDENTLSNYEDLNKLIEQSGISAEEAVKAIKEFSEEFTLSTDLTSNLQDAYDLLKATTAEYQKTGQIGLSSLESIAKKYPQLRGAVNSYIQGLISAEDMMAQLKTAYDDDANAFRTAMAYKLSGNEKFFSEIKDNNQDLFKDLANAYGLDVDNWKTMAQAKAQIDQELIRDLSSAWSKYYSIVFDSTTGLASVEGVAGTAPEGDDGDLSKAQRNALNAAYEQSEKYNEIINKLNDAANITVDVPDFGGIGSGSGGSGSSSKKDTTKQFDWTIEAAEKSQKEIDKLQDKLDALDNWKPKNKATDELISKNDEYIKTLQSQLAVYQGELNKIQIAPSYIDKIQNGTMKIEDITDDAIANNVQNYQDWYKKIQDVKDEIDKVNKSTKELAKSKLDNIINNYESLVSLREKYASYSKNLLNLQKDLGEEIDTSNYENLISQQEDIYNQLSNEYETLSKQLSKAVSSGDIKVGTDEWRKYNSELIDINSSMNDVVSNMNDFRQSLIDLPFEKMSNFVAELDNATDAYSTLSNLIGDDGLTDKGMITSKGLAKIALYGKQYTNAKQKAAEYANAIEALKDAYDDGKLTQDEYNKKLNEYQKAQLDAVGATKTARDAIVEFRKTAIQEQIDDYNKLIEAKKKAKQEDKAYADYLDEVAEKQKKISNLQTKIDELSTNSDASDRSAIAMRLQLENDLTNAKKDLAKTQADYAYDQQLNSLDKQAKDYKDAKDKELDELKSSYDAQQKVVEDYLGQVKNNYKTVYKTLTQYGDNYNVSATEDLTSPWSSASNAVDTFQSAVSDAIAQINIDIDSIDLSKLTGMINAMNGFSGGSSSSGFEDITGTGTWQKGKHGYWYGSSNDDYASDGIYTIGGKQYSFNEDGYMKTGWNDDSGEWRYFEPENGQMVKSTWRKDKKGKEYYLTSDGTMARDMAIKSKSESGVYYYVDDDGVYNGKRLTYNQVKKQNITVGYTNGTRSSVPGLKEVEEDKPELIFTKDGTILNSAGGDMVLSNGMMDNIWGLANDPTSYITDKLLQNQMDLASLATVNRVNSPVSISFSNLFNGSNVSDTTVNDFKVWANNWATKELPNIMQQNMTSY